MNKIKSSKITYVFLTLIMVLTLSIIPTFAASSSFSGSTGTMNSLFGGESTHWTVTSPSFTYIDAVTSTVTVDVTVSGGSDPFYLYVQSPDNSIYYKAVAGSTTLTFPEFSGEDPEGKWQVYIKTAGDVSTATARLVVNYTY